MDMNRLPLARRAIVAAALAAGLAGPVQADPWGGRVIQHACDKGAWVFGTDVDEFANETRHYAMCQADQGSDIDAQLVIWRHARVADALVVSIIRPGLLALGRQETVYRVDGQSPARPAALPFDMPSEWLFAPHIKTGAAISFVVQASNVTALKQGQNLVVRTRLWEAGFAGGPATIRNEFSLNGIDRAVATLDKAATQ